MSGHAEVKKVSTEATAKYGKLFTISVKLNVNPDYEWNICFKRSRESAGEFSPWLIQIKGDEILFQSSEKDLTKRIGWLDKYISQANECYRQVIMKKEEDEKKQKETRAQNAKDIERINKTLANQ